MGGIGQALLRGLAGAAVGYGKGIAQQGQMDWDDRKARAAAALKAQQDEASDAREQTNALERIDRTGQVQGSLAAANDTRQAVIQEKADNRRTQAQIMVGDRQFQQQVKLKSIDASNERSLTMLRGTIAERQDAAGVRLREDIAKGEVKDIKEGSDGFYYGVRKNGDTFKMDIGVPAKASESEGGTLAEAKAKRDAAAGGAAPAPRAAAAPKPPAQTAKTYTMAEAQQTAKNRGVSVESVQRIMESRGYKLASN